MIVSSDAIYFCILRGIKGAATRNSVHLCHGLFGEHISKGVLRDHLSALLPWPFSKLHSLWKWVEASPAKSLETDSGGQSYCKLCSAVPLKLDLQSFCLGGDTQWSTAHDGRCPSMETHAFHNDWFNAWLGWLAGIHLVGRECASWQITQAFNKPYYSVLKLCSSWVLADNSLRLYRYKVSIYKVQLFSAIFASIVLA